MAARLMGCLIFLGFAGLPLEIAGRLASEGRSGWGRFLLASVAISGVALNLWAGETPGEPSPTCRKGGTSDELR